MQQVATYPLERRSGGGKARESIINLESLGFKVKSAMMAESEAV